jgi:capsular polysaccharide biosynthesis protein
MVMITILVGVFATTMSMLLAHIAMTLDETLKRQEKIQNETQHLTLTLQHTNTILGSVIDEASGNRYKSAVRTVPEARY